MRRLILAKAQRRKVAPFNSQRPLVCPPSIHATDRLKSVPSYARGPVPIPSTRFRLFKQIRRPLVKARQVQLWCLIVFLFAVAAVLLTPSQNSNASAEARSPFKKLIDARARSATREVKTYSLPSTSADKICSLLVSAPSPAAFGANGALQVTLRGGGKTVAGKSLHAGDPDLYTLFRSNGAAEIEVASFASTPIEYAITVLEWPSTSASTATVEAEPNDTWSEANEFKLGQTVWASADDKPYILPLNDSKETRGASPYAQQADLAGDRLPEGGVDWFKFTYEGDGPKLVHFELDLLERDNIPVDVSVFTVENGEVKPYNRGIDPVTPPHEVRHCPATSSPHE